MSKPYYKVDLESLQEQFLAPYAIKKPKEGSRDHEENPANLETRTEFQRDRDRIIHSKSFRRMMYKTQVFVNQENDHYRTRLTHSLEVAQMSRGIARSLRLNEDLTEAIALGHDLGHTPYGHAVEDLLGSFMDNESGFYHNEQSVRVVELLEEKPGMEGKGLNLTWEVREGILKHTKDSHPEICKHLNPSFFPSLEGQVVRLADTIAYVTHDFEDAYFSSSIFDELIKSKLIKKDELDNIWDMFDADKSLGVSSIVNKLIVDLVRGTQKAIDDLQINSSDDVRKQTELIVRFDKFKNQFKMFKDFVTEHVYTGSLAAIMDTKAKRIIGSLYQSYLENPKQLPPEIYYKFKNPTLIQLNNSYPATYGRVLIDFLSGLTDRYAVFLYNKLFNQSERIISSK